MSGKINGLLEVIHMKHKALLLQKKKKKKKKSSAAAVIGALNVEIFL